MTLIHLRALTWATVLAAVASVLLLAAGESGLPDFSRLPHGEPAAKPLRANSPSGVERTSPAQAHGAERSRLRATGQPGGR